MTILVAILYVIISACVESQPVSAPLPKPAVYEWTGTGPPPSLLRLAHDKSTCVQEAGHRESRSLSDRWQAHVNRCMEQKGWGQKIID